MIKKWMYDKRIESKMYVEYIGSGRNYSIGGEPSLEKNYD